MPSHYLRFILSAFLAVFLPLQSTAIHAAPVEAIVLTEPVSGPPLWKVKKGDSTLYVLAVAAPMPKSFEWDPSSVEAQIIESQEFLPMPDISVSMASRFHALSIGRKLSKMKQMPDGRTLPAVIPAETHAKLKAAIKRYGLKKGRIERLKPFFAAEALYKGAKKKYALVQTPKISKQAQKIAKKNKLLITPIEIEEQADNDKLFNSINNLSYTVQLECLLETLNSLDKEVAIVKKQAMNWVAGEARELAKGARNLNQPKCIDKLVNNQQLDRIAMKVRNQWLDQVEAAFKNNKATDDVVQSTGLLSALKAKGYKVYGPIRK